MTINYHVSAYFLVIYYFPPVLHLLSFSLPLPPFLPLLGAKVVCLWSVVPELLLDYQDYQQWLKDGGVVTGSAFHPESEEEFLEASRQAWTHLLMQIIKVSSIFTLLLYKWRNGINSR